MVSEWETPRNFREVERHKLEIIRQQIKEEIKMPDREHAAYLQGARDAMNLAMIKFHKTSVSNAKYEKFKSDMTGWSFDISTMEANAQLTSFGRAIHSGEKGELVNIDLHENAIRLDTSLRAATGRDL